MQHCKSSGKHKRLHSLLCSNTYTDTFMVNVHHNSIKPQERVVTMCRLRLIFKCSPLPPLPPFITIQHSQRCDSVIKQLHHVFVRDESGKQEHMITLYRFHKCVLRNSDWNESGSWPFSSRKKRRKEPCDMLQLEWNKEREEAKEVSRIKLGWDIWD